MMSVLALIVAPLLVIAAGALCKMVWDMRATLARDEDRWARQEKLWDRNRDDHRKAFEEIGELKVGQSEIKAKLDILLNGSKNDG